MAKDEFPVTDSAQAALDAVKGKPDNAAAPAAGAPAAPAAEAKPGPVPGSTVTINGITVKHN